MQKNNIIDNEIKRIEIPLPLLLCNMLFTVWQMGIVFFSGTTLSLYSSPPIPVSMDNLTPIIVGGYFLSIIFLLFFQKYSVMCARICLSLSLLVSVLFFIPFSNEILVVLIKSQTFLCVFLIGITMSIIVNLFSVKSELYDIFFTAVIGYVLIAILQNDLFDIPYWFYNAFTVIALSFLLFFFIKMPSKVWPTYIKKRAEISFPKRFTIGVYFLIGISCILTLFGETVAETVPHGISIFHISNAVCGLIVFLLYKFFKFSPLRLAGPLIGLSALGFVLSFAGKVSPFFSYLSVILVSFGFFVCSLVPFYGIVLTKKYPSKYISIAIVCLACATVVIHTLILQAFKNNIEILYIIFSIIAVLATILYLMLEPTLIWSVLRSLGMLDDKKKLLFEQQATTLDEQVESESEQPVALKSIIDEDLSLARLDEILSKYTEEALSGQELRVASHILNGYVTLEIAEALGISENTVKSYRKNLYFKLQIHSRRELFLLATKK